MVIPFSNLCDLTIEYFRQEAGQGRKEKWLKVTACAYNLVLALLCRRGLKYVNNKQAINMHSFSQQYFYNQVKTTEEVYADAICYTVSFNEM